MDKELPTLSELRQFRKKLYQEYCHLPVEERRQLFIESREAQEYLHLLTCRCGAILLFCVLPPLLTVVFFTVFSPHIYKAALTTIYIFMFSYCLVTPVYAWIAGSRYAMRRLKDPEQ